MISIAGIVGNNFVGFMHNSTKVNRALKRKSEKFLVNAVIRNAKEVVIRPTPESAFPVLWGHPDCDRLVRCFENIAYGLYYHTYSEVFKGQIRIMLGFIHYQDPNNNTLVEFLRERFKLEERALDVQGENPSVFQYQFCKPDEFGLSSLKLTFYGATEVFIAFLPDGKEQPYLLGMELLRGGIPTIITLKDKTYEFNNGKLPPYKPYEYGNPS